MVAIHRAAVCVLGLTVLAAQAQAQMQVRSDALASPAGEASGLKPPLVTRFEGSGRGDGLRWRLAGDYYFAPSLGLRASGGLRGEREHGILLGQSVRRAAPYVGLGYSTSGTSANRWGGWGLSADIGVQASGSSDLQLGVSYAF